ncbi:MAG: glycosyltransferase [Lachnospiraceae bacterium]|nr:glycosyltransferase [Lachnospiraceae bacterium]
MSRALILTTTSGFLSQFELNNVRLLQENGYQVHYATNFGVPIYEVKDETLRNMGVVLHHISIEKNPFKIKKNIWALRELIRIIDREQIDVVHCHNPNGGVLGRLAAACSKRKPYVIYTAHGFHFFEGAPIKNWLFYYPVEKLLARLSDTIITINQEDYARANQFKYKKNGGAELIPGVGVNLEQYYPTRDQEMDDRNKLRKELGIPEHGFHIVSAGELNQNKNHIVVIEALAKIARDDIYYSICGEGPIRKELEAKIKECGLSEHVFLRGYRNDMPQVWKTADLSVFPSIREGMGMVGLEAMASGIPLIAADNRGTREYVTDQKNGLVCKASSAEAFAEAILYMYKNEDQRRMFAETAMETVKKFSLQQAEIRMKQVYQRLPYIGQTEPEHDATAPMISVIMGVYNQQDLTVFEKAVHSVLDQSYSDFEFLIYNDGSSIPAVNDYIHGLEKKDRRIRVLESKSNHGLGYALNRCIEVARGTYLARMDVDDISCPNRFEEEITFLEEHPEYMWCGSNCKLMDEQGIWGEGIRPEQPESEDYLKYSPYIHPTVMYRASLFKKVAGYAEGKKTARCEDYELFMRLFRLGYKGYNIQKDLLNYRVDRNKYHDRSLKSRIHEGQVRYEGFRALGILWPKGWLYIFRPLASVCLPANIVIKKKEQMAEL